AASQYVASPKLAADLPRINRVTNELAGRFTCKDQKSENLDSAVMMSSVKPTLKYASSGSPPMSTNGITAIDGPLGNASTGSSCGCCQYHAVAPPSPTSTSIVAATAANFSRCREGTYRGARIPSRRTR